MDCLPSRITIGIRKKVFLPLFLKGVKMNSQKFSRSKKIFLRREKSRIRRNVFDVKEQEKLISALYPAVR
jgi:hypothetical protein